MSVEVKVFRVDARAAIPEYKTAGAVGMDLQTMVDLAIPPGCTERVPTGIAIGLPDGWEAQLRPRSSTSGKSLLVHLGTCDADYRGHLMLNVTNVGNHNYHAKALDRIAQMVIKPAPKVMLVEVNLMSDLGTTARGESGFGSTGTR